MSGEREAGPCVIVTHSIRPGTDAAFLDALRALQDVRRAHGWVTDHWLVLKHRDEDNTYTQIVEYMSQESEEAANTAPDVSEARRRLGEVSIGRPQHVWTTVALHD